ncbi:hypothetical protein [Arcobacter sp. s6]
MNKDTKILLKINHKSLGAILVTFEHKENINKFIKDFNYYDAV